MSAVYKTYSKCQVWLGGCRLYADRAWRHLCPPLCPLCRLHTTAPEGLCMVCQSQLPLIEGRRCSRCAAAIADGQSLCGNCLQTPPPFEETIAAYRYAPPIDQLICSLKFSSRLSYARILGFLLIRQLLHRKIEKPDCLLPTPLHSKRLRLRGFNQSLEIARPLSRYFGLTIANDHIKRVKAGVPQTSLSGAMRRKNMRGAFRVCRPLPYRHVVIVDDVLTTGATVTELAHSVRSAGAQRVSVWALARTD